MDHEGLDVVTAAPVRIAAIGVGRLGLLHAQNLARHVPGAELAVVVDVDAAAARRAGEYGAAHTTDYQSVLADPSIRAVTICAAADTRAGLIVAAARAGKHVYCETPLALTLDDANRVAAAVAETGVLLHAGFMRRYDPAYQEAKRLIDAGEVGRPFTFYATTRHGAIAASSRDGLARRGGIFADMSIHDYDLARWLMSDEVCEVYATGTVLLHEALRELGDADNAVTTLRFAGGGIGYVHASHTAVYGYDVATEVTGERGAVRAGALRGVDVWRYDGAGRVSHDTIPDANARFAAAYRQELIEFIACIQEGRAPLAGAADARAALAIALAARQSFQEGRPVYIREVRG